MKDLEEVKNEILDFVRKNDFKTTVLQVNDFDLLDATDLVVMLSEAEEKVDFFLAADN